MTFDAPVRAAVCRVVDDCAVCEVDGQPLYLHRDCTLVPRLFDRLRVGQRITLTPRRSGIGWAWCVENDAPESSRTSANVVG